MVESTLSRLAEVFSQMTDPRQARGVRHPFQGMVALVFVGLLGRITEMAVLVRWAAAHWDELREPLGFTREQPPCDTTVSRSLAKLSLAEFREVFARWLKSALADRETLWVAAVDGKTCCQGLAADGSPVHMLNVFLQQAKLTLDQWSVNGDKTNEPGSLQRHLKELLLAYPALGLLTGDAIFAQRPLLELLKAHGCDYLFQVMYNRGFLGNVESEASSGRMKVFYTERSVFDGQEVGVGRSGASRRGADAFATGRTGGRAGQAVRHLGTDALSLAG